MRKQLLGSCPIEAIGLHGMHSQRRQYEYSFKYGLFVWVKLVREERSRSLVQTLYIVIQSVS